jgi:carbon-monoxide dehydrogenase medium subunit
MKPAPFQYFAPTTTDEALALLHEHGYDAKVLAGGQSLVPTMNFRLAQPAILIDLNRIPELFYIQADAAERVRIGAMTRQRAVERSTPIAQKIPLLHAAMPYIAHAQIRNRGTVGGSLAHADPAAELPAVAVAAGARLRIRSTTAERWVDAADFYIGLFTTDLAPDEMVVEVEMPVQPTRAGWSIQEIARREGDYALVGVAVTLDLDDAGRCREAHIVFLSVGEGPVQAREAARVLVGEKPIPAAVDAAAEVAARRDIDPTSDIHATAAYRRHLAQVLTKQALTEAAERANQTSSATG